MTGSPTTRFFFAMENRRNMSSPEAGAGAWALSWGAPDGGAACWPCGWEDAPPLTTSTVNERERMVSPFTVAVAGGRVKVPVRLGRRM